MCCGKKNFQLFAGFALGIVFFAMFYFVFPNLPSYFSSLNSQITFDEALRRVESRRVNEIHVRPDRIIFYTENKGLFVNEPTQQEIDSLIRRVSSDEVKISFDVNSLQSASPVADEMRDWLPYLFQILIWLFFLSPPLIVILLVIIIKKMDQKQEKLK